MKKTLAYLARYQNIDIYLKVSLQRFSNICSGQVVQLQSIIPVGELNEFKVYTLTYKASTNKRLCF